MEKDDGAGMDAAEKLLEGFLLRGLFVLVPVHVSQAPEKGGITELLCHLKVGFAVFSLGRAVVFFHSLARDFRKQCLQVGKLFFKSLSGSNFGHVRVMVCMVPDNVAVR